MPYAKGAYTSFTSLPAPDTTTVVSARGIDPRTGKYQVESDGSFTHMSGAAQRVYCAEAFDSGDAPRFDSDIEREARKQRVAAAVEPLASGAQPAIALNQVRVEGDGVGAATEVVDYRNLHADPDEVTTF